MKELCWNCRRVILVAPMRYGWRHETWMHETTRNLFCETDALDRSLVPFRATPMPTEGDTP
jgi:hypothetical protein